MFDHIDQKNLHHAYLIEGSYDAIRGEIFKFLKPLEVAEFIEIKTDSFKIEDARNLKSLGAEKSFSSGRKIFIIAANNILREAQNAMLKLFEEPIPDTHFFMIVPDAKSLLRTLVSRFFVVSTTLDPVYEPESEKFLAMLPARRIDFIKEKMSKFEDVENITDSVRADAMRFLDSLESILHRKMSPLNLDIEIFQHIWKVRDILRMPGSSVKNLLESVALTAPVLK